MAMGDKVAIGKRCSRSHLRSLLVIVTIMTHIRGKVVMDRTIRLMESMDRNRSSIDSRCLGS